MLEVVDGLSEKYLLEISGLSNVVSLAFLLNVGDISNLNDCKYRKVMDDYKIDIKLEIYSFLEKVKNFDNIRIWFSSINSEDYTFFYFINYLLNNNCTNKKVYSIDVGKKFSSLSCSNKDDIKQLLKLEKELSCVQIYNYACTWKKLTEENGDLRLIDNYKLVSYDYEYLDAKILEILNEYKEIERNKFIGRCMVIGLCSIYSFCIFNYRISKLIERKNIYTKKINNKELITIINDLEDI